MKQRSIRIGVVGAGKVAGHYSKLIRSGLVTNCEVVGVTDVNTATAEAMAGAHGCAAYTDSESLIENANPELMLILTPSGLHYADARVALDRGIHVLIEKPATLLLHESEELARIAEEKNLLAAVGFQNRFNPAMELLKRTVDAGDFGKIVSVSVRLIWCRPQEYYDTPWRGTWKLDGGVSSQQAIHHIDALRWIFGPVDRVCSTTSNRINDLEAEDTMVAIIELKNGAPATLEATTAARPLDYEASISVTGECGMAEIGGIALNKVVAWNLIGGDEFDRISEEFSREFENGFGTGHIQLLQQVVDALCSDVNKPPVSLASGTETLALIHALYKSNEEGRWVGLDERPVSSCLGREKG